MSKNEEGKNSGKGIDEEGNVRKSEESKGGTGRGKTGMIPAEGSRHTEKIRRIIMVLKDTGKYQGKFGL